MAKKRLILIGGGGHAKVVIDAARKSGQFDIYGMIDPALKKGIRFCGIKVLGGDDALPAIYKKGITCAFICVGSIGDYQKRESIDAYIKAIGFRLAVITHPKSVIAEDSFLGEGTFVAARAVVNPGAKTGRNVIINTSSSVDHDCEIGDFVHIAPGAILSGGVKIGRGAHIGIGAWIVQNVSIGSGCMVGSGEVVRRDLEDKKSFVSPNLKRKRVFIIAEAGVNHNGSLKLAKKMVDSAGASGADAIKFQTFKAENLATHTAPKASYQKRDSRKASQLEMLRSLELNEKAHKALMGHCRKKRIKFLSSAFDLESVDLLKKARLDVYKIPSGQITDMPYLKKIGALKKKVILSSGMSGLEDIKEAIGVLIKAGTPKKNITVLHCNTEYPTPYSDVNLSAMLTIREKLGVGVGYSDHTKGIEIPVAAVSLGAEIIEKHFTLDRKMAGPDHKASLEPGELKAMVNSIRNIENALGSGSKHITPSELKNMDIVRKSIVASRDIRKDELLTDENMTTKRPAKGISPMEWDSVIGRRAKKGFKKDEMIKI